MFDATARAHGRETEAALRDCEDFALLLVCLDWKSDSFSYRAHLPFNSKVATDPSRQPMPTRSPEIATKSRLARTESTSNPAGIWQIAAVIELVAMAIPISPDCHWRPPFRKTEI